MSIKYIILGYLSWQPLTGYDLKKIIADAETLSWSASNNQIYHALVQLHHDGLVTKRVELQDGSPNRHIYAITKTGQDALKAWVQETPEPPESKKSFFLQLMWADCLAVDELDHLLETYLNVVGEKLFFIRVQAEEKPNMPERTPRESYLWHMIHRNWIAQYELELQWIRQMREELGNMAKRCQ